MGRGGGGQQVAGSRYFRCALATASRKRHEVAAKMRTLRSHFAPVSVPRFGVQISPPLQPDPRLAESFYQGLFPLGGVSVDTAGLSPFELSNAPHLWQRRLHGFAWLRHLEASQSSLSRQLAQSLVDEWLHLHMTSAPQIRPQSTVVWELDVVSERAVSLILYANFLMQGRDEAFASRLMDGLARQLRHIRIWQNHLALTSDHLIAVLASTFAAYALNYGPRTQATALRRLRHILGRQCTTLNDNAGLIHLARRPSIAMELIPMLVVTGNALREANGDKEAKEVLDMIEDVADAMAHWAAVAQHSGGGLAVFNGAKDESLERVSSVLALGRSDRALLEKTEICGGYGRLSASGTTVICDVGPTPAPGVSASAQAGTLSFEMSSGGERVIINCGSPEEARVRDHPEWRMAARQTAAHSAVSVAGKSSSSPARNEILRSLTGNEIVEAVSSPKHACGTADDGQLWLHAEHSGYANTLGLNHRRAITITADGRSVMGEDSLIRNWPQAHKPRRHGKRGEALPFEARFHTAAGCRLKPAGKDSIEIQTSGGRTWTFGAESALPLQVTIAPSLQINHPGGPAGIQQIVVSGEMPESAQEMTLRWQLSL